MRGGLEVTSRQPAISQEAELVSQPSWSPSSCRSHDFSATSVPPRPAPNPWALPWTHRSSHQVPTTRSQP